MFDDLFDDTGGFSPAAVRQGDIIPPLVRDVRAVLTSLLAPFRSLLSPGGWHGGRLTQYDAARAVSMAAWRDARRVITRIEAFERETARDPPSVFRRR